MTTSDVDRPPNAARAAQSDASAAPGEGSLRYRFLAFAPNTWDGQWMNRQHLLTRIARRHCVIYTNGPWSWWDRRKPEFQASPWLGRFELHDRVWVDCPAKALPTWPTLPAWDRFARRMAVARWKHRLAAMGDGPLIAYVFHPMYARYAESLDADLLVYQPYDLFSETPEWTRKEALQEQGLLQRSTLVVVSSKPTRDVLQERTGRPVHYVPNGVDAEHFIAGASGATPDDLERIPHPRIGYVGSLNRKVDFDTVAQLAKRVPTWHFVLMGPMGSMDDVSRGALASCRLLPNVHILPERRVADLPAFMGALDVGLMCYRRDTWMDFGYPLKLHEYLAAGIPVVSTPLPSIREFDRWIERAETLEEWQSAIERSLRGETSCDRDERRRVARANTWDARVATLQEIFATALASRPAPILTRPVPAP
jgi:glycosyltransferase involved in cell wall biosynthesis